MPGQKLPVDAFDRDMKTKLSSGTLTTIDNEIDQTTGTVKLRATFNNSHNELFPESVCDCALVAGGKARRGAGAVRRGAAQFAEHIRLSW